MSDQNKNKIQDLSTQELLIKIYENTEKTRKYILWARMFSVVKLIIIVIPIVLAIVYLPPYFEKIIAPYKELLNLNTQAQGALQNANLNSLDLNSLLEMYYK